MIAKVHTSIPYGFDGRIIEVECAITQGLPQFDIVGMANKTVSEARQRVRNAIKSSGLKWPDNHITINLAPAELVKNGNFFDLPITIAILVASGQMLAADTKNSIFSGELSLDGKVRPVRGIINLLETGKTAGFKRFYIPTDNLSQASLLDGISIIGVSHLTDLILYLTNQKQPKVSISHVVKNNTTDDLVPKLAEIRGQELAKKALITAIAGRHNILLSGPPGAGKTMLAKAAVGLMPALTKLEQIEVAKIQSLAGHNGAASTRPFRSPHHTSTIPSLIGGGNTYLVPGEISLAHLGVLFLDELPEYPRTIIESLRQPLEDKKVTISRANMHCTYPANFMLIATMNPCPCGYFGDKTHPCKCKKFEIERYKNKLSGPLLDRIDIKINVERTTQASLRTNLLSAEKVDQIQNVVKNNITDAIARQHQRYGKELYNADLTSTQVVRYTNLSEPAKDILNSASERLNLSARSYFKVIKVARTIADLAASNVIESEHVIEALSYRFEL